MKLTTAPQVLETIKSTLLFSGYTNEGKEGLINCITTNDIFLANGYINKTMHRQIEKIYIQYLQNLNTINQ